MSAAVVDASVAAKWFLAEQDSTDALALLNSGRQLLGPHLLAIEVNAAITRRHRNGLLSDALAIEALADAAAVLDTASVRLERDALLLPRGAEIALAIRHPLQDCLYIACAERNGADLITADPKLIARASAQFPFVRAL